MAAEMAFDLGGLPQCGVRCISALIEASSCASTNETCLCAQMDLETANPFLLCVAGSCTVKDGLRVKNFTVTNCENPETPHLNTISIAFLVLFGIQTVFFILRMLTRVLKLSKWGWDDATIIVAFVATIGVIIGRQLQIQAGMGKDIWTLTPDEITHYIKMFYIFGFIYTITLALVKASICFLYLRLFTNRSFRRVVWATQAFNVAVMVTFIFAYAFQCTPASYFWNMWHGEHQGKCLEFSVLSWTHSGIGIVLDLWLLALPFWQVIKLKLPLKKRMDAFVMFGCGIFLTIVSVLRLQCLVVLTNGHNPTKDLTWLATWSNVEIAVGIIIACLPSARLLILRYLPSKVAAWNHSSRATRSTFTARSSKLGSTATWVSGKRESNAHPPSVPLSDALHFDKDRCTFSAHASAGSPVAPAAVHYPGAGASFASGPGRRDSEEIALVPGFDSPPLPCAPGRSSGFDETPPILSPRAKDRRIWVEQHIYVSNDPVMGVSTDISRGDYAGRASIEPWIINPPGTEDV